jgi:hypothetical protein
MGHALGLQHDGSDGVMSGTLTVGERQMPTAGDLAGLDALFGSSLNSILG